MSSRILLALAIGVCCAHLSVQMMIPAARIYLAAPPTLQEELEFPCNMLPTLKSNGGLMQVSRVWRFQGEEMCTVPANHMPKTMDELLDVDQHGAASYAGSERLCDGVLLNKDMCLTRRQDEMLKQYHTLDNFHRGRWKRKALRSVTSRWKNKVIPYEIKEGVFSAKLTALIIESMRKWERGTCLTFRPAQKSDTDKVLIEGGFGCFSGVGRVGGVQKLSLGAGMCRTKKVIMHELGHAIGLIHEHQRDDRDRYVTIQTQNVHKAKMDQFNKISQSLVDVSTTDYDYTSLMHYGKSFFSSDGKSMTIQTTDPKYQDAIGRADKISFTDYKSVNFMYKCAEHCPDYVFCVNGGYIGPSCQCVCPEGVTFCTARTNNPFHQDMVKNGLSTSVPPTDLTLNKTLHTEIGNQQGKVGPIIQSAPSGGPNVSGNLPHSRQRHQRQPEDQNPTYLRVLKTQKKNGRHIVHLATSNVPVAIQAILDSLKNGRSLVRSYISRKVRKDPVRQLSRAHRPIVVVRNRQNFIARDAGSQVPVAAWPQSKASQGGSFQDHSAPQGQGPSAPKVLPQNVRRLVSLWRNQQTPRRRQTS